jgi:CPA1 family monovalent cation:H+ antiporter
MTPSGAVAALVTIAALASYINHRFLRLPATIGMMALALAASLVLLLAARFTGIETGPVLDFIRHIDFRVVLLDVLLPYLLFASALHVDVRRLREQVAPVAVLSTLGVAISTLVSGGLVWSGARALGIDLSLAQGLLFGALIAPTDPIAVLGILRGARAPAPLEALISGESLFNDGVGVVLFLALYGIAVEGRAPTASGTALAFLLEGGGGIAFGLVVGWIGCHMLRGVDDYPVEIFLTLALAAGGYAAAQALHTSGPLATVAAGLVIASAGREIGMSETTRSHLDDFWEVIDEMLNAVLFVLLGLEMVLVAYDAAYPALAAMAIAAVLLARWLSVAGILAAMGGRRRFLKGTLTVLTWGGLRGAISVSLALSLPPGPTHDALLTATYVVVVFSVLVQGLTLARVARRVSA